MTMEYIVRDTLEKSPETTLAKYPILRVAYREDGTRKDLEELLKDRGKMLERGALEDETNKLLLTILESRETSKEEMLQQLDTIEEEIYKKGIESGFEYDLLKRTLQRGKMTEEKAEKYIEVVKSIHKERRTEEEAERGAEETENETKSTPLTKNTTQEADMFKQEFDEHMKAVAEAKARGDKDALKELSDEMYRLSGHGNYLSKAIRINSYFKDYMDKREFDEHMKAVAEAKARGDEVALRELASDMREYSGYATHLSETPHRINSYFKDYMDNRQNEQNRGQKQKHRTQEESFRDEVGNDENTDQVLEGQEQTTQEVQWMGAMKGISDRVTEIEGYSKKQGEIVQAVSLAEKQKEAQRTGSMNIEDTEK